MTIFEKIIARQISANIAYEDDRVIAIHDIEPKAPLHLLVIPKKPIPTLNDLSDDDAGLMGDLFLVGGKLAREAGHDAYRAIINCGEAVGQSVFHIHLHIMAGRPFAWPPG